MQRHRLLLLVLLVSCLFFGPAAAFGQEVAAQGLAGGGSTLVTSSGTRHQVILGQSAAGEVMAPQDGSFEVVGGLGGLLRALPVPEPGMPMALAAGLFVLARLGRRSGRRAGSRGMAGRAAVATLLALGLGVTAAPARASTPSRIHYQARRGPTGGGAGGAALPSL